MISKFIVLSTSLSPPSYLSIIRHILKSFDDLAGELRGKIEM